MTGRSMIKRFFLGAAVLLCAGCEGGIDCPIDPPACCENVVFGCGLFDLPQGCSCSQYGLAYTKLPPAPLTAAVAPRSVSPGLSGNWSGILQRGATTCSTLPAALRGSVRVAERKGIVNVTIAGYGQLRGKTTTAGYSVTGRYSVPFSSCSAKLATKFTTLRRGTGKAQVQIDYSCSKSKYACSAQYRGTLQKQ